MLPRSLSPQIRSQWWGDIPRWWLKHTTLWLLQRPFPEATLQTPEVTYSVVQFHISAEAASSVALTGIDSGVCGAFTVSLGKDIVVQTFKQMQVG